MIEIRPEELLTLCVRPRLGRMIDEDKRQRDQRDGRRIHLTEEEICLKNRDQLSVTQMFKSLKKWRAEFPTRS